MKIATYNINGIRAAIKKGFLEWLKECDLDIICLQEVKIEEIKFNSLNLEELGYECHYNFAQKSGYSGVVILTKFKPNSVKIGLDNPIYDREGRGVQINFEKYSILNVYIPSGSSGESRHEFKMQFLEYFKNYVNIAKTLSPPMLIVGDYNIVHKEVDIHNPKRKDNPSGYRPDERKWLDKWFDEDYVDAFRVINQGLVDNYSWWSYRAGSKQKNKGWRIDYISVDAILQNRIKECYHIPTLNFSDHCPVIVDIDI